jgi:nucleoid-associated protein YgaU
MVIGDPAARPAPAPDSTLPPAGPVPRVAPPASGAGARLAPTALTSAPVARPPSKVTSHEEEQYVVQPNDTFEDLSLKFYGTKAYARGLFDYNYAHPQTTARFKQSTKIMVGEMIYLPERAYMERLYGRPQAPPPPGATVAPIAATPTPP